MIKLITYLSTFLIIILAELGDKTQIATLIYSSNHPAKRWQVFGAAAAALVCCVVLEVTVGVLISRFVGPATINKITGVIFIIIGLFTFKNFRTAAHETAHPREPRPRAAEKAFRVDKEEI